MDISAPQKSEANSERFFRRAKCTVLVKPPPLLQGRWINRTPCPTISTLIFWGTDPTRRSCRAGSSVREKVDPLKQRKKTWSRKFISQKQLQSCLARTKVNRVFPPPLLGIRLPSCQCLFLDILQCFRARPGISTSNRREQRLNRIK